MKTLFEQSAVLEVRGRIAQLRPDSARQWGKMNVAQAVAHCAAGLEMAVGDRKPPRMFVGRMIGPLVKRLALGAKPLRPNSPTAKDLVVQDERDLEIERKRLDGLVSRFSGAGTPGCTTHPHTFFGRMTPAEWGILMYKHLDHHLRQFGV